MRKIDKKQKGKGRKAGKERQDIHILEYEAADLEAEIPGVKSVPGNRKIKTWQKILLVTGGIFFLLICSLGMAIVTLHKSGREQIQEDIKAEKTTAEGKKEDLIYHDGKAYRYRQDMVNILCMGVDKEVTMAEEKAANSMGQSDAIFIVSLDQKNKKMRLLAIPRDTMTEIDIYDTADKYVKTEVGQITLQYTYGDGQEKSCELVKDAVSKLCYGLPIQRFCSINFQAIPVMNDRIGGVPVIMDESIIDWFPDYQVGDTVVLHGEQALQYLRQRDEGVFASSMDRMARQKSYMVSFAAAAKEKLSTDITLPVGLFNDLQGNMCTDIEAGEITYLATEVMGMSFLEEDLFVVPGETRMGERYEEYHVNEEEFKKMIISMFYDEVSENTEESY
ncbi:LCP family protein [Luxibacter massiliensis]|uniref:LCP family protein n=1 Tax=Luxibacter massiliensis TaxID=2219695 RepID=UPI000F06A14E|nr:LCP family protein [Luxibacter massiliensis]